MEVEYLTKAEWTQTIDQLFTNLSSLNDSLMTIASYLHLFLVLGSVILILMLMYNVLKKFI